MVLRLEMQFYNLSMCAQWISGMNVRGGPVLPEHLTSPSSVLDFTYWSPLVVSTAALCERQLAWYVLVETEA